MRIKLKIILVVTVVLMGAGLVNTSHAQVNLGEGDLARGEGMEQVYFLHRVDGELLKRWIPSPEVFNSYHPHFRWENIKIVAPDSINGFKDGIPMVVGENIFGLAAVPSVIDNPKDYLPSSVGEYMLLVRRVPVYASLDRAQAGVAFTTHGGDRIWVDVLRREMVGGQQFAFIRWDNNVTGWVRSNALGATAPLSHLRGVELAKYPNQRLAMVYTNILNVRSTPGVMNDSNVLGQIHKYNLIFIQEERFVGGILWYRIGQGQWIHSWYVRNFNPGKRPAGVGPNEKWIEVNLKEQVVFAHEGDTPVYATLAATGRPGLETITGLFRPWLKLERTPARGTRFGLVYNLADAPWWVFFSGDYGWHGAYWHDNFGTQQSAGCVNLSPFDSQWFFQWSDPPLPEGQISIRPTASNPGTWVYVHRGF